MPYTADLFTNYATSSVAGGTSGRGTALQASDTTLYLPTSDGAKFPSISGGQTFRMQLGTSEIVIVTARSTDTLTVTRGAEGTSAQTWQVGTTAQLVVTATQLTDYWSAINQGRYYNIKDYGAKCDGSTDDISAWTAAITAAKAAGNGVIFHPGGTSIISTPIVLDANDLMILGAGRASVIQPKAGFTGAACIYFAGGGSGIDRVTLRDFRMYGGSTTLGSNPACDGIQFNSPCQDTVIDGVEIDWMNGWAVQILAGASGFIGYTQMTNVLAKKCATGFHFASTVPGSNRTGGVNMANCVADDCKNGDSFYLEEIIDNTFTNCQGYSNNSGGSSLHIKGCAFTYLTNFDLGGGGSQTTPCVLIEKGSSHSNDHIYLNNILIQKGQPGMNITGAAHLRITDCDVYFNQTHGIQINDDATNGAILIQGCNFYQNNRTSAASTYEINNLSTHGSLLIRDCNFETGVGGGANQVAATIASPNFWQGLDVQGNDFQGGSPVFSPAMVQKTVIRNNAGFNPVGSLSAPGFPATTVAKQNDRGVDCSVWITTPGGVTISAVAIGGTTITGVTAAASSTIGPFRVPALQTITITYAGGTPTWQWFGD